MVLGGALATWGTQRLFLFRSDFLISMFKFCMLRRNDRQPDQAVLSPARNGADSAEAGGKQDRRRGPEVRIRRLQTAMSWDSTAGQALTRCGVLTPHGQPIIVEALA